ncbi:MAG: hypothetical protein M3347_15255, partial [Armatimonadota bacterium]|nr:hypothetical protein [Armatimonadota bacterium]
MLGEKTANLNMKPGEIGFIDLDFALPTVTTDRTLNLKVRVAPASGGEFYDDVPITVYAPHTPQLPAGQKLVIFDPKNAVIPTLQSATVALGSLAKLGEWNVQNGTLLIGSDGLNSATPKELAELALKIEAGGKLIVLDHFSLPQFLPRSLVQSRVADSYVARVASPSPVMNGILSEDLRAWTTRERDQVTSWNALETPSSGQFRVHATTVGRAPVLEVGQGNGRVLFVQLNMKDALGVEPAATRVLANVLNWTGAPSPFVNAPTVILAGDDKVASGLRNRIGLQAKVAPTPDANLIIASGASAATRANLEANRVKLKSRLENGGTLFFYGLDEAGAKWLSAFIGSPVSLASFPHKYAYLTQVDAPLTAGLGHGDFWPGGLDKGLNPHKPLEGNGPTGTFVLSGPQVQTLTQPAYVSQIPVGKGRIVVDLVRSLENPVPSQMRVLSVLLSNAGAPIDPDNGGAADTTKWKFQTIDLTPFVNWSLTDTDDPKGKRGYNGSGADDDLRDFPTGQQNLRGVEYDITPAEKANGNSLIMLAGKNAKLGGVTAVKGIPVHAKAERLYFLHNSAWGVPGFIYRVYYTEDRKAWIPGKADPFVDVVVKPGENITEWVAGGAVESQKTFLGGATVAWLGGNKRTRSNSTSGDKALGVYQMAWDNPHPEKEIESIDIISPQTAGSGNAFVFAITAATRDEGGAATKPDLAKVLPKGTNAVDVLEQVQFPNYGFVLLKNGVVASIYDARGQPFARSWGWEAQAAGGEPGQPRQSESLGKQGELKPEVQASGSAGRRVWEFSGSGTLDWKTTVIATPGRLRYELRYTPRQPLKPGFSARLTTGLNFINGAQAVVRVNENPLTIKTASGGEAILAFDKRYTRWVFSYELWATGITIKSPTQDTAPWRAGQEEIIWWEITPP